jgi:CopG antitoxin of type II toxin-antitoxin system
MASNSRQSSIEQASEYWDHHSLAEHPSHIVEIEYAPEARSTLVAIENDLLARISKSAKEQGVSVETLVNLWLQEKLTA